MASPVQADELRLTICIEVGVHTIDRAAHFHILPKKLKMDKNSNVAGRCLICPCFFPAG